jgi:hypothetical protein
MAVTAAGMEADLAGTGEVAADSGADHGTAVREDMAAAEGGLAGCRDTKKPDVNFVILLFRVLPFPIFQ